ncbi:FKBP-type peptidyl-prolyl cis-trans isomerase [Akkermansia glycaniphila]|uniref:FKBP-type peptidyl-prolyl cis-trans isomerase N-terminal domain-containing protein n=1 Tax=Akkermansia glycaniphila TaxID=1679444 RepID=UPI001C0178E0|nr:FKBP-type peptidyl-prolyl cis-trans isomerase N-terminal domain-containing protein [Akkermansia glycaniphila]MBT9449156.1 FKBP-type peptidyl-prolyl cis-trans isomerase [Akkermansia glycaniphila]
MNSALLTPLFLAGLCMASAPATSPDTSNDGKQHTPPSRQDISAYLGYESAVILKNNSLRKKDIDLPAFRKAFAATMKNKPNLEQFNAYVDSIQPTIDAATHQLEQRNLKLATDTLQISRNFLEENGKKPGIVKTSSGLQYRIDQQGAGSAYDEEQHGENPLYSVRFKLLLMDGTLLIDKTEKAIETSDSIGLEGFDEALTLMPVGSKWTLYLPPHLAFGDATIYQDGICIPGNSVIIIEAELQSIKKDTRVIHPDGTVTDRPTQ